MSADLDLQAAWEEFNFEHWKDSSGLVHIALVNHAKHWIVRGAGPTHEAAVLDMAEQFRRMRVIRDTRRAAEAGHAHPGG